MEYITRKTMLYKTGVEYGDYSMNHVLGCSHGCKYPCYAYLMKKRFGQVKSYDEWCKPKLVANTLELLDAEIPRLRDKIQTVLLCFSTDPFPYVDTGGEIRGMSMKAMKKLNDAGIVCKVLTKGVLPPKLGFLFKANELGISLVSLHESFRARMEPNTAPYAERIAALKKLHDAGCKTWVSIEPYPTPNIINQSLTELLSEISFVDKIIFGRTNYSKEASSYLGHKNFYNLCSEQIEEFCHTHNIKCRIKRGTISAKKITPNQARK